MIMMTLNKKLKGEDETLDSFYLGRVLVLQKKRGYRFSVDAPLLADFIQTAESDELLELGAGNGIISLLLSIKPFKHITALEIQESLADLARRNVQLNKLEDKISIIQKDLLRFRSKKKFDIIFSNPPYIKKNRGHLSPSAEKSIAKHELKIDIFGIMRKTGELLKREGRAYFIFRARRKEDFMQAVEMSGLKVRSVRFVQPRQSSSPNFFMTECDFTSRQRRVLPPFILYDEEGNYTKEAEEMFRG
ncbi:MAG: methyltransferase [Candidatus Aminicenantes bacterium]|nr:MAG: methyltransferase [Candidatus Aminicenantes bacterium]